MKHFAISIIAVCTALMLTAASHAPASRVDPPDPKYVTIDLSWVVETIPGNATSTTVINGTVQDVYEQVKGINPSYIERLNKYLDSKASMTPPNTFRSFDSMADRPGNCGYCNVCTKRWAPAAYMITLDGINYLRNITGRPASSPGPGSCGRVSCEWGTSIWWCNDSDERKELDSWGQIADAAEDITRQCFWYARDKSLMTGGQIFQPDGWNVVVRHEGNDC
ncbi:hypothetical protein UCDDA912_g07867 [Diaporthe ampelina]|uniref:Secreted protein n=1 Tax=Diaporthe ampelina TaxID=1214573 RepID=A0A0G2FDG2_9PEZI|nr:hypothetical protein UCDDA912_g07867 [Diaporthe ampelina]